MTAKPPAGCQFSRFYKVLNGRKGALCDRRVHGGIVPNGGWGGIRTPGALASTPVFKTGAINHSATHPETATSSGLAAIVQGQPRASAGIFAHAPARGTLAGGRRLGRVLQRITQSLQRRDRMTIGRAKTGRPDDVSPEGLTTKSLASSANAHGLRAVNIVCAMLQPSSNHGFRLRQQWAAPRCRDVYVGGVCVKKSNAGTRRARPALRPELRPVWKRA